MLDKYIASQLLEGGEKTDTLVSSAERPKHKWNYFVKKMYCFSGMGFRVHDNYFGASPLPSVVPLHSTFISLNASGKSLPPVPPFPARTIKEWLLALWCLEVPFISVMAELMCTQMCMVTVTVSDTQMTRQTSEGQAGKLLF